MARDEEFRKVAEDLRALGRSLARDFWQAADQARRSGRPPSHMIRHGLRQMAGEARRGLWGGNFRYGPGPYRRWTPPPGPGGPGASAPPRPGPWSGPCGPWGRPGPRWSARPRPVPPARPPVRRRWDAMTILAGLVILFGTAWLLGAVGELDVPAEGVVALGLMILGVVMIVTARTDWSLSRHSWPVFVGAGLLVVLAATSSTFGVGGTLTHLSFGNMSATATSGRTVYGGFGNLSVDATNIAPGRALQVRSGAGRTVITTAAGVPVELHAQVGAGEICVQGHSVAQGVGASVDRTFSVDTGLAAGGPTVAPVQLDVHQLAGEVAIDGTGCSR